MRTFHTGKVLLAKYQRSWLDDLALDIPNYKIVKLFKKSLTDSIISNKHPHENTREFKVLYRLITDNNLDGKPFKNQIKELNSLVSQKRISDDQIYKTIKSVVSPHVINVQEPRTLRKTHVLESINSREQLYPSNINVKNNKTDFDMLSKAFNLNLDDKKQSQSCTNKTVKLESNGLHNITHTDLEKLRVFLQQTEKQDRDIKKMIWDSQKKYQWDHNESQLNQLSRGYMLFGSKYSNRSSFIKFGKYKTPENFEVNIKPKEFLIYDLKQKTCTDCIPNLQHNFNINYTDLFSVINGNYYSPEEVVTVINDFETKGWELLGNVLGSKYKLVFQRSIDNKNDSKKLIKNWIIYIMSLLIVTSTLIGRYKSNISTI